MWKKKNEKMINITLMAFAVWFIALVAYNIITFSLDDEATPTADTQDIEELGENAETWEVEVSLVNEIRENNHIKGEEDTQLTWIEYSDIDCPFCQQQSRDWTVDQVIGDYEWQIWYVYQNYPVQSQQSEMWANALQCASELASDGESFFGFKNWIYALENITNRTRWEDVAEENNIDVDELNNCIDEERYQDEINDQENTGRGQFGVTWTPANIIVNNETGEFVLMSGALPAGEYDDVIEWLSN